MNTIPYYSKLAEQLIANEARKATKYISDKLVVTATRRLYGGKIDRHDRMIEILFKDGAPNYAERQFIKACKKAGEPFPVRNIQLKWTPQQKRN